MWKAYPNIHGGAKRFDDKRVKEKSAPRRPMAHGISVTSLKEGWTLVHPRHIKTWPASSSLLPFNSVFLRQAKKITPRCLKHVYRTGSSLSSLRRCKEGNLTASPRPLDCRRDHRECAAHQSILAFQHQHPLQEHHLTRTKQSRSRSVLSCGALWKTHPHC
jgi:hypothetical protein